MNFARGASKYLLMSILAFSLFFVFFHQKNIFTGLDKFKISSQALTELRLENQGLKQEIEELKDKLGDLPKGENFNSQPYVSAQVYSRYPFNDNQALIINAGSKIGVKAGWPVLAAEHCLLGKIFKVKTETSEVQTIFSPDWKSGVRIGQAGVEAVLVGGRPPKLEFIPADAKINSGDEVSSASSDLPLNLLVGKVNEIISQPTASLQTATLRTDYDPNQLRKVFIITDYEGFD